MVQLQELAAADAVQEVPAGRCAVLKTGRGPIPKLPDKPAGSL
ncbi:MAG: hypothetical protein ACOYD3_11860 [Kiritimatiellia bacterium]